MALGNYGIEEQNKRGIIGGGGIDAPIGDINVMVGNLFSYEGKGNRLSIPYIDDYGIFQKPVFGISSFGGKEIRKWSHELYKHILDAKEQTSNSNSNMH